MLETLLGRLTLELLPEALPLGGGEDGQGGVALGHRTAVALSEVRKPDVPWVWSLIERTWREAGALRTLAALRLGWAETAPSAWKTCAQLVALCELEALGEPGAHRGASDREDGHAAPPADEGARGERSEDEAHLAAAVAQSFVDDVLEAADFTLPAHAWPAFCLAAKRAHKEAQAAAAQALHKLIPIDDARHRDVLAVLGEAALARGDAARALELCEELGEHRDPRATKLHLKALRAQGRNDELLALLFAEAERTHGAAQASAWLDVAAEQGRQQKFDEAQASLARVPEPLRALAWAQLAYDIESERGDAARQADAAALAAHAAPSAAERAQWLRREASLRWWALDEPGQGQQLLRAAHSQAPLTPSEIDAALLHLAPHEARRRLEEAMVVLPRGEHAPLWRRLASLLPPGEERNVALGRALDCSDDNPEELARLLKATRSAGVGEVLARVLCRLAHAVRKDAPAHAAELFLEAAGLTPTRDAAPLWVDAAEALAHTDNLDEARALTRRALGAGVQSVALWQLVWQLLPSDEPVRLQAAAGLVAAAAVPADDAVALHLAAAEHAQLGNNHRLALELIEGLREHDQALEKTTRAALVRVHERTLESAGDIGALVRLWLGVAADDTLHLDERRTYLRRAAYLLGPLLPLDAAHEVFSRLVALDADDPQAITQLWSLMARKAAHQAGAGTEAMMQSLVADIEARLGALSAGEQRSRLGLIAVQLIDRHPGGESHATMLLGRELRVALAVWQQQGQSLGAAASAALWQAVVKLSEAMVARLAREQHPEQQLAVMAHTARVAPEPEREPLLVAAGLLARDLGQLQLAFSLLYPVAMQNPSQGEAVAVCMALAREQRRADILIELLTRRAQKLTTDEAAEALEEAADWAREGLHDLSQMLRLLQAAQALAPTLRRTERLLSTLIHLGGLTHLQAAQQLLSGTRLPAHTLRRLGLALGRALDATPEGQSAAEALWEHLAARLPQLTEVRERGLRVARTSGDPPQLLQALLSVLGDSHVPCGAEQAALHAETAGLAQQLGRTEVALAQWCCALSSLNPRPSWLVSARRLAGHPGKLSAQAKAAFTQLERQIDHWVAASRHMLLGQAGDGRLSVSERLAALALLGTRPRWDAGEVQQALTALAALREQPALASEEQRVALALEAQLLRQSNKPQRLIEALSQLTALLPIGKERAQVQRELGEVLGRALNDWPRAVTCLQAALAEQPGDETLRLAAAQALVMANRPHEALPYVMPSDGEGLQSQSTEHLEVLLSALVAAQAWREILPVARQLLGRQPGHLPALRAQARALLAQGAWDEARIAHETLAMGLAADGMVAGWRRATGRSAEPEAIDRAERALVLDELAQLAVRREDTQQVCSLLREALALSDSAEAIARRRQALRQACLSLGAWAEAAQLAFDSAQAAPSRREAGGYLLAAAELWQTRCGDIGAARRALWQASELAPDEAAIWWQLRGVLSEQGPQTQRAAVAEHLLALVPHAHFDAALWAELAAAFAPEDAARANALFGQAEAAGGVPHKLRSEWCEAAWRAQDHQTFVPLAEALEGEADAEGTGGNYVRRLRLAEACLRSKSGAQDRRRWLMRVLSHDQPPASQEEAEALKRLADLCASQSQTHRAGLGLYGRLLQYDPLNAQALRIAARLAGALGDVDRAYGLYACLLWLLPEDAEAERFVAACRSQHAAQQSQARHTTKLLVRRVQQALEQLDATGAAPADSRPRRAFDVAQLLRRDIEEVLAQMLPVPSSIPRPRALTRSPDAMALFCFAQSPAFFTLRRHLGAQLEAAGVRPAPQQSS